MARRVNCWITNAFICLKAAKTPASAATLIPKWPTTNLTFRKPFFFTTSSRCYEQLSHFLSALFLSSCFSLLFPCCSVSLSFPVSLLLFQTQIFSFTSCVIPHLLVILRFLFLAFFVFFGLTSSRGFVKVPRALFTVYYDVIIQIPAVQFFKISRRPRANFQPRLWRQKPDIFDEKSEHLAACLWRLEQDF